MFRPRLFPLSLLVLLLLGGTFCATGSAQTVAGEIAGAVKDSRNRPIAHATVRIQGGPLLLSARTDGKGAYRLPELIPGSYDLLALKPGYVPVHRGLVVVAEGVVKTENFELAWADETSGGIDVLVMDPQREPVTEGSVDLYRNGVFLTSLTVDDAGTAIFPGLTPGSYSLRIEAVGYFAANRRTVRVVAGRHTTVTARLRRDNRQSGSITGSVQDLNGTPLRNALVRILEGPARGQTRTNGLGLYTFRSVPPGAGYSLQANASGFAPQTLENVTVGVKQATTVNFRLLEAARQRGSITGIIRNSIGLPVALATVTMTAGPGRGLQAVSGPDGRYTFTDLEPSPSYALLATSPGHSPAGVSAINVPAGRTTVVNFLLQAQIVPPGTIGGTVTDRDTGAPLGDVLVEVVQGISVGLSTLTDAGGNYVLEGLVPHDSYILRFSKDGYDALRVPFIQVRSAARSTANAQLPENRPVVGVISGKVVEFGNQPVAGAKIVLFSGPSAPLQTTSNSRGEFTFSNLRVGNNYAVRASKEGYATEERRNLRVQDGQTVPVTLELRRGKNTGNLQGRVLDLLLRPVSNATVRVVEGPSGSVDARTNSQGEFRFEALPPGRYTIDVFANGFRTQRRGNLDISPGGTTFVTVQLLP